MRMLGFIVFISSPGDHVRLTENRCTAKRFICFNLFKKETGVGDEIPGGGAETHQVSPLVGSHT